VKQLFEVLDDDFYYSHAAHALRYIAERAAATLSRDASVPARSATLVHCKAVVWHADELNRLSSLLPPPPQSGAAARVQSTAEPTLLHHFVNRFVANLSGAVLTTAQVAALAHCEAVFWHANELARLMREESRELLRLRGLKRQRSDELALLTCLMESLHGDT
jgi:hypothetical protein